MKHFTSSNFWALYEKLPLEVRELANKNFELLKANPYHPSLHLKRIEELWSARIGLQYRVVGISANDGIQWIWIGSHADYNKIISK